MRTRTIDNRVTTEPVIYSFWNGSFVQTGTMSQIGTPWTGEWRQITDENHPNYAERVAAGEIIIGDLDLQIVKRSCSEANIGVTWSGLIPDLSITGDVAAHLEAASGIDTAAGSFASLLQNGKDIAYAKALAKINSSAMMSSENIKDIGASVSMLREPLGDAQKLVRRTLRAMEVLQTLPRFKRNVAKAAASAWLEYRYGWKPIVMDCQAAIEASENSVRRMAGGRLVARAKHQWDYVDSRNCERVGLLSPGTARWTATSRRLVASSAGVIYVVSPQSGYQYMAQTLGLRGRDIEPSMWELTPFSFVADWFWNTGTWLQAIAPAPNVSIVGTWVTTVDKHIRVISNGYNRMYPGNKTYEKTYGLPGSETTRHHITREKNPYLSAAPVALGVPLNLTKSVDAVSALLGPLLSGLERLRH